MIVPPRRFGASKRGIARASPQAATRVNAMSVLILSTGSTSIDTMIAYENRISRHGKRTTVFGGEKGMSLDGCQTGPSRLLVSMVDRLAGRLVRRSDFPLVGA